ncbi:MAG: hypothetical protein ACSLFO_01885 [Acidimicrobiales bacterium]
MTSSIAPSRVVPGRALLIGVFVVVAAWAALGSDVRASADARTTADEPQYLLSAISIIEDGDLDIRDELIDERWREFHEADLPRQTEPRADGREVSPHDPLLPLLLAPGVGLLGWVGARITMALVAGALATLLVWTATARFGVGVRTALVGVGAFALGPPLAAYGSQIYPELPAAFAVTAAVAALTGEPSRQRTVLWLLAVVALPWLGVKYAGVAVALGLIGLWRDRDRAAVVVGAALVAGAVYLAFHQAVYGGWTVYAAGDHFVTGGEFAVVGDDPNHAGRTVRLLGLLVDRHFGLVAWAPVHLLAVPAIAWLLRGTQRVLLLAPLAAGWATATWVALTMHGYWWPGRQTVVVLPLVVLVVVRFLDGRPRLLLGAAVAGVLGAISWLFLVVETTVGPITLIADFESTSNPWIRAWRLLLPDERVGGVGTLGSNIVWSVLLAASAVLGWRAPGRPPSAGRDEDALAGEGTDADDVAVDLHRGGAIRG